jgi:hypothetical protein
MFKNLCKLNWNVSKQKKEEDINGLREQGLMGLKPGILMVHYQTKPYNNVTWIPNDNYWFNKEFFMSTKYFLKIEMNLLKQYKCIGYLFPYIQYALYQYERLYQYAHDLV